MKNLNNLKFHIIINDYFGTLATILSLIRQNIKNKENNRFNMNILKKTEDNLIFLQKNYKIVKIKEKDKKLNIIKKNK